MSTYYLSTATGVRPPTGGPIRTRYPIPTLSLQSLDGSLEIPLDGSEGLIRMPGSTGLEMAPVSVTSQPIPGTAGSGVTDIRVEERPIFIPIYIGDIDEIAYRTMLDKLRRIVDPYSGQPFKLVGTSVRGTRELIVTYQGGLEGSDSSDVNGLTWQKFGLNLMAGEPFARDMVDRDLEFRVSSVSVPFLGVAGGTDTPFPVSLSSGSVIGTGMTVNISSEVPVYPVLELTGPMDSFLGTLSPIVVGPTGQITVLDDQVWTVDIPAGVPAGQVMRLVTDPRIRSFRLNGALAAGRIARGSALRAFYPGQNVFDVVAPGGSDGTRIRLSWRELHWSLW